VITLGNTILEVPMSHRSRYFESYAYRTIINDLWKKDKRVLWKAAPKPTMADSMFNKDYFYTWTAEERVEYFNTHYFETSMNETEMAFDAADIMRAGKDIFIRKTCTANNLSLDWLRREFPELRVHMFHTWSNVTRHADEELIPIRPPTAGSSGLVLFNEYFPLLKSEM